ncbi:MAG: aspartate aminotransferase family protein [Anaerolinea sp.]|nr:aspartate aminotransferase family protein [Anaerolinea sp.]
MDTATRMAFVPGGVPFAIDRAEGAYLITPSGQRILDAGGGAIVMNIGHGRREVAEVAAREMERLTYVIPPFQTESRTRLVDRLVNNWLPPRMTRATFTSGGSESVEAALRLARQHHVAAGRTERWKVIGLDISYHGVSLGALSVGNHVGRRVGFEPILIPFPKAPSPYRILGAGPGPDPVAELERVIVEEGPDTVAAFIAEPVVGSSGGVMLPPEDYWRRAVEVCHRHGVLVIADEVMTGFGRTGKKFGVDQWGVVPDIMVGGKGLAGGYAPMGGLYATEAVVAPLAAKREDLMFYTFAGHPASCAVADKVLEIMEREELVARADKMGGVLRSRLDEEIAPLANVGEVRGLGLMLGIELVQNRETMERFPAEAKMVSRVTAEGLKRGVFFYPGGSGRAQDVVMLGPPFIINGEDIDTLVGVLAESIAAAVGR